MKHFRITKHFRGGSTTYYASMENKKVMGYKTWEYQLQEWGENTVGGYNYGWRIHCSRCKSLPRNVHTHNRLNFNKHYLKKIA